MNKSTGSLIIFFYISGSAFSQVSLTVEEIVYDLLGAPYHNVLGQPWGAHEGLLHGVPSHWDWYWGARPGAWMEWGDNRAVNLWAQAYEWQGESSLTNIRIQVRQMKLYALVNGEWRILSQGNDLNSLEGANWKENFQGASGQSNVRSEKNNGGGISFNMIAGHNFHWWVKKWPRAEIPEGTLAFYSVAEMRLIPDTEPAVDLSQAKYLASIGNDYYTTPTTAGPGPWPSLAIARHKFLTPEWQTFTAYISGNVPNDEWDYYDHILSQPLPPGVSETFVEKQEPSIPVAVTLHQNFPNPFNATTIIDYQIKNDGHVNLSVCDLQGRTVEILVNEFQSMGNYRIPFHAFSLASGTYLLRLQMAEQQTIRKIILLR